jgi:hypothetical protein
MRRRNFEEVFISKMIVKRKSILKFQLLFKFKDLMEILRLGS